MADGPRRVFRLPRSTYLAVLVVAIAATAVVQRPIYALVYLLPVALAVYIARTSTVVDARGITVRALFGARHMCWDETAGITVVERNVYAVVPGGLVRLPCVRIADLHDLGEASGGRLPEVERAKAKYAPSRRRRR